MRLTLPILKARLGFQVWNMKAREEQENGESTKESSWCKGENACVAVEYADFGLAALAPAPDPPRPIRPLLLGPTLLLGQSFRVPVLQRTMSTILDKYFMSYHQPSFSQFFRFLPVWRHRIPANATIAAHQPGHATHHRPPSFALNQNPLEAR